METGQELLTMNGTKYLLNIEQAKKLNLLKEKDNRVRNWDEFKEKYENIEGYTYVTISDCMLTHDSPINTPNQLTPHEATALAAFSKLLKLRRDWIGEWEPNWLDPSDKFILYRSENKVSICTTYSTAGGLSFPTRRMAKDFLKTFHDLIEEAKTLI